MKRVNRVTRLEDEVSDLHYEIERLKDQISEILGENDAWETEVDELKGEVADLERRLESAENARDEFRNELEVKTEDYNELEAAHSDLSQDALPLLTLYEVVQRSATCRSAFDSLLMAVKLAAKREEWDEINGL